MAFLPVKVAGDVDFLTRLPSTFYHIFCVHEDDPTVTMNATISVIEAVNGRVILVVAAKRHHDIVTGIDLHIREWMVSKVGAATGCGKRLRIFWGIGEGKTTW